MLDFGFEHYELQTFLFTGQSAGIARVQGGEKSSVSAVSACEIAAAVSETEQTELQAEIYDQSAPVFAGQTVGRVRLVCKDEILDAGELVAGEDVPVRGLLSSLLRIIRKWILLF